jgi:hypothetical protein
MEMGMGGVHMEQQLADKLAQQQADLDEQLAFVQVCQYFKIFHKFARSGVCLHGDCIRD